MLIAIFLVVWAASRFYVPGQLVGGLLMVGAGLFAVATAAWSSIRRRGTEVA